MVCRQIRATGPFSVLLLVVMTAGFVACAQPQPDEAPPVAEETDSVAADATDAWITTKVRSQYFADADVHGLDIGVTTDDGVVTLTGFVDDVATREQAIQIARNTDGARDVVDRLMVDPERTTGLRETADRMSDIWISTTIQSKFFTDPDVRAGAVDVTTANGVVVLTGTVETDQMKQRALAIAEDTEGVTRVVDSLQVGSTPPTPIGRAEDWMTDRAITMRVQAKLFLDDDVRGRRIKVDTSGGVVTLMGQVGSPAEEQQALTLARSTSGVSEVVDALEVVPEAAERDATETPSDIERTVADGWITARLQSKFFLDDQIRGLDIDVDTLNAVVTLTGTVPAAELRTRAVEIARATSGVRGVVDQLVVGPAAT